MINSAKDLELKLSALCDPTLAQFIVGLVEKLGQEMYFQISRGGAGTPYEVITPPPRVSKDREGKAQVARARVMYEAASIPSERKHLLKVLAELTGSYCQIRVNASADLLDIANVLKQCCVILGADPSEHIEVAV